MRCGSLSPDSKLPEGQNTLIRLQWQKNGSPEVLRNLLLASPKTKELNLADVDIVPEMFDAMLRMAELDKLTLFQCTLADGVDLSQLKTLKQLEISSMNLPAELGHLPELEKLRLSECTTPEEFSLVDLPAVTRIDIDDHTGGRSLHVKDAPHLGYIHTASPCWEFMVFEGCPSLQNGSFGGSDSQLKRLDLRRTKIRYGDFCLNYLINSKKVEVLTD